MVAAWFNRYGQVLQIHAAGRTEIAVG